MKSSEAGSPRPSHFMKILWVMCATMIAAFLFFGYALGVIVPPAIPAATTVIIVPGMNAEEIATSLKNAGVIRSRIVFVWLTYIGGLHDKLGAGKFVFSQSQSAFRVLAQMLRERKEIAIVIPEGSTARDISLIFAASGIRLRPDFDRDFARVPEFIQNALVEDGKKEGFLFPDTYRFYETADSNDIVYSMLENFVKKVSPLQEEIKASGKSLREIVTMASIVEEEAREPKDKQIVASVLWKRIEMGMPLQTDATLYYELGKASHQLTLSDLENPTPYNTYRYKGLPPGPITNPGLDSIEAALRPSKTSYVYYLTGRDGKMHYARTFEEHKKNRALYLD